MSIMRRDASRRPIKRGIPKCYEMDIPQWNLIVLGNELMHVFREADDNDKGRANAADQEHPDKNVIQGLKKNLHCKSVLPTVSCSHNLRL